LFDPVAGRNGVLKDSAIRIGEHNSDAIGVFKVGMHDIVLKFIADIQENENGTRQAKGKTKHVEQGKKLLALKISQGDQQVIADHREQGLIEGCCIKRVL
jgi:hypothetical protein